MSEKAPELAPHLEDAHLITKRRVEMGHVAGNTIATDFVRPDQIEEYVADARRRWAFVIVSDEPDAGPLGYHGPTSEFDHSATPEGEPPLVVSVTEATPGSQAAQAVAWGAEQAEYAAEEARRLDEGV